MNDRANAADVARRDIVSAIDRALAGGHRIEISRYSDAGEDVWTVDAATVVVTDASVVFDADGVRHDLAFAGPRADAILPLLVPVDRAHALAAEARSIRSDIGYRDRGPLLVAYDAGAFGLIAPASWLHVASSGVYPPVPGGLPWDDVATLTRDGVAMTVADETGDGFTMARAA